jgi:hypothetical protein
MRRGPRLSEPAAGLKNAKCWGHVRKFFCHTRPPVQAPNLAAVREARVSEIQAFAERVLQALEVGDDLDLGRA